MDAVTSQRIVFIDVDGTILEHGSVIAPSTITAIRTARRNGHLVYLCTGRSDGDIHPDVRDIVPAQPSGHPVSARTKVTLT